LVYVKNDRDFSRRFSSSGIPGKLPLLAPTLLVRGAKASSGAERWIPLRDGANKAWVAVGPDVEELPGTVQGLVRDRTVSRAKIETLYQGVHPGLTVVSVGLDELPPLKSIFESSLLIASCLGLLGWAIIGFALRQGWREIP